jgi:hypothetical protein
VREGFPHRVFAGVGNAGAILSSSSDTDVSHVLPHFLTLLQDSQSGSFSYSANDGSPVSRIQSLIVNYSA